MHSTRTEISVCCGALKQTASTLCESEADVRSPTKHSTPRSAGAVNMNMRREEKETVGLLVVGSRQFITDIVLEIYEIYAIQRLAEPSGPGGVIT